MLAHAHSGNTAAFLASIPSHYGRGLMLRDYKAHPQGSMARTIAWPQDMFVPKANQQAYLDKQVANKSSLWDLREANYDTLQSLDQDGLGLCWAFSSTKATMYMRALMNEPGVVLSAWWVAGKIKNWRDEGGWGAESLGFIGDTGVPAMSFCPSYSSSHDSADCVANAALHKMSLWYDGTDDRETNTQIMISAFLLGLPTVLDYNWLSHSMCGCRLVSLNPLTVDCDNSWGPSYSEKGIMRISGSHAVPDNIVVPAVNLPSLSLV